MRAGLAAWIAMAAAGAVAQELPRWELGAGAAVLALPDYRGSDQGRGYLLPLPYAVYRGDFLKADRRGVRGALFDSERVDLNLSLSASLPVDSSRNRARAGMPDLHPSLEFGPSLELALWQGRSRERIELRMPVRTAFTLESSPRSVGWVASPNVNVELPGTGALRGWNIEFLSGLVFGDRRQHAYFYSVATEFATSARPAYEAGAGYAGAQFRVSASRRFDGFWFGAFLRADTLRGASFAASPLLRRDTYVAAGAGIAWILGESRERVASDE